MLSARRTRKIRLSAVAVIAAIGLVAVGCTNPSPANGFTATFKAKSITNTSFVGDWPTTFWDPDAAEEPYLVHLGIRVTLTPKIAVTTTVTSTYLNDGQYMGKIASGETLNLGYTDGVTWSGVDLPDTVDLGNGTPLELLGSVEFLFDRDQLIPIGIAQILAGVSDIINASLPSILQAGGLPTTLDGVFNLIGAALPGVFTTIVNAVGTVIGSLTGGDTFFGFRPVFFIAAGGGLGEFLKASLPSLMDLVNNVLKILPDTPFPNGLPLSLGVVGQDVGVSYSSTGTSAYNVNYGWNVTG